LVKAKEEDGQTALQNLRQAYGNKSWLYDIFLVSA
jgi:hypothetical protein